MPAMVNPSYGTPTPTPEPVVRDLPRSMPLSVMTRVRSILADIPDDKRIAFIASINATPGDGSGAGWDLQSRIGIHVRLSEGWSFGGFVDKETDVPFVTGAELRFVR